MKNASANLVELLKNGESIQALPEVVAEWNLNRYHDTRADNVPNEQDTGYDIELFPAESMSEPLRPHKGINKARVGHSLISKEYFDSPGEGVDPRFYVADTEDVYKYWTSPLPAVGGVIPLFNTTNFPSEEEGYVTGHDNLTSARPFVEYGSWDATGEVFTVSSVQSNKIVIKLENTWATPNDFDIVITRESSSQTITNEQLVSGWEGPGEIVLRFDGTTWAHTTNRVDNAQGFPVLDSIKKIQLVVRTLKGGYHKTELGEPLVNTKKFNEDAGTWSNTNGSDSFLDVIEISARMEAALTPWVINTKDTFDTSEVSNLYPVGTITSNNASLTLSNIYEDENGETKSGIFSADNTDVSVPWRNYLERNVEVRSEFVYYEDEEVLERVPQFKMFVDEWTGQASEEVSVELTDYSKFLNEQTVRSALWEDLKVPEIVWRILDSVGFNNFEIGRDANRVTEHRVPVFFTNEEQTVWEVLDELAKATQTAIFFDSSGALQVKTRDFAFSAENEAVWNFSSEDSAEQLSNIVSLEQTTEYEPNRIKVFYQKTNWSDFNKGQPVMQKVWEPEDIETLRATELVRDLAVDDNFIWIGSGPVRFWPYEGIVNIQGELIRYKGKHYVYYTGANGGTRNTTVVESEDERRGVQRKKAASGYQHKSHFSGALRIAKDEGGNNQRGLWNSEPRNHEVEASGYSVRHITNGVHRTGVSGFKHLKYHSKVQMITNSKFKTYKDILIATRGATDDNAFFHYGTKLRFSRGPSRTTQCAGIVIHNTVSGEDGYYIELTPGKRLGGKERKNRNELIVYSRVNGKDRRIGNRGRAVDIIEGKDYELDVTYVNVPNSTNHRIQVWLNGKNVFNRTISGTDRNAANGKFGVFARGKTDVRFEFLYAIRREEPEPPDDFSFLDKIDRGYVGARWDREWVYRWTKQGKMTKKKWRKARRRKNRQFFDEFGPIVHEVREYDVKFDPTPVLHSRLFMTNDWSAVALDYNATPFGAKFLIANTSRRNAVLNGDDSLSYAGTNSSVNQVLTVLGRPLVVDEEEEVIAENTDQIRMRGKIESEISSPWIQSKAMANDIANWIRDNFTYGNDGLSIDVFGNPLVEVGDVVHVEYPDKHINGDYFVTGTSNSFESGISTSLQLRRRV